MTAALEVSGRQGTVLLAALWEQRRQIERHRSITEKRLAEHAPGHPHTATLTRLACHEECDLAAIDELLVKLGAA